MATINTQYYKSENLKTKYGVSVDKEGNFTTTLPPDIAKELIRVGIDLKSNRLNNYGFFSALSLKELKHTVEEVLDKYSEKELLEEKVILRYSVETACSYCKTKDGQIVPNGSYANEIDGEYDWTSGTLETNATERRPFGFSCFVKPISVKVWKFSNGEVKKEYLHGANGCFDYDEVLKWLDGLCGITSEGNHKEIDYTPELGLFFKNMILYIFSINEKIKNAFGEDFDLSKVTLDTIKKLGFTSEPSLV